MSGAAVDLTNSLKCELAAEVLGSTGQLRLQVTGWSMWPSVRPRDLLMIERAESDEVSIGDIILFGRNGRLCAHRLVARSGDSERQAIVTRGDAMPYADPPVITSQLLGRVAYIIREGRLIEPSKKLAFTDRVYASLVERSRFAGRFVAYIHGRSHSQQTRRNHLESATPCRN